jgi:DNA repair exonuclease SbcCD ATPase subunit
MSEPTLTEAKDQIRRLENRLKSAHGFVDFYRKDNARLKERWETVLQACCNAEAEVEHLQEKLETTNCHLEDANNFADRIVYEVGVLRGELAAAKGGNTKALAEVETKLAKLAREYDVLTKNYTYALEHKGEQDKLIADAGNVINKLREEIKILKSQQVDQEHLAKKLVELQGKLVTVDALQCPFHRNKFLYTACGKCTTCKLEAAYGIIDRTAALNKQLEADLKNQKSRIANNFSCEGSRTDDRTKMCGSCAECLLKQTYAILDQTSKNLIAANKDKEELKAKLAHQTEVTKKFRRDFNTFSEINTILRTGLRLIMSGSFLKKGIAKATLDKASGVAWEKINHRGGNKL